MESDIYAKIESILKDAEIDAKLYQPKNPDEGFDALHIFAGTDHEGRESCIHLIAKEYGAPQELIKDAPKRVALEFVLGLSCKFSPYTLFDVARLVSFINLSIELPGFFIDEVEDSIGFRYVWVGDEKGVDEYLILGLIGSIRILRDLYAGVIEDVAIGKKSLENILEQIVEVTKDAFGG